MNERLLSERHWGEVTLNQGEVTLNQGEVTLNQGEVTCPSEGVMG